LYRLSVIDEMEDTVGIDESEQRSKITTVFWNVMPSSLVQRYQHFRGPATSMFCPEDKGIRFL
jgi:hypothetical protein